MNEKTKANPRRAPLEAEKPVMEILKGLKEGSIQAKSLPRETRKIIVEYLCFEGCTVPEIADIFKLHERTIRRDRKEIRAANALSKDPRLRAQMAGQVVREAEHSAARLRRINRERGANARDRVDAERSAFNVTAKMVEILAALGYLDGKPNRITLKYV